MYLLKIFIKHEMQVNVLKIEMIWIPATTKNTESSPDSILDIHENCQIAYCYSNPSQAHSEIQYSFFFIYQLTYISDSFQGGFMFDI